MYGVAIINPVAGASKERAALRESIGRLQSRGIRVEPLMTTRPGEATRLAREAAGTARFVVAVGGDGTIREVADGLIGTAVPMMVWPTGTENLVAKSLGFRTDPDLLPACLTAGREAALDVGIANGRSFLVVAGAGFDAEVVGRLVDLRRGHITHLTYLGPLWRTFWEHRFPVLRVILEGKVWWEGQAMAFVGNMSRYSLGLPVVRDAVPDDGRLDLLVLPCRGRVELIAHSLRTIVARHLEHGDARYTRCSRVRIESDAHVPVELDGDPGGFLPVDIRVQPGALRVQLPPADRPRFARFAR